MLCRRSRPLAALAALTLSGLLPLAHGCKLQVTGDSGKLSFSYADSGLWPFSTPVAVGARVDVSVVDAETGAPVTPDGAVPFPSSVFAVQGLDTGTIGLFAKLPGSAELEVRVGELTDSVDLEARDLATLTLSDPIALGVDIDPYVVLVGGEAVLPIRLEDASGRRLIGYGMDGLVSDPPSAATLTWTDVNAIQVASLEAGAFTVTHPAMAEGFPLEAVPATDVADLFFTAAVGASTGTSDDPTPLPADGGGALLYLHALLADGATHVMGLDGVLTLSSFPAEVCTADSLGDGWYQVNAVDVGACTVQANLLGTEQSATWEFEVVEGAAAR